MHRLIFEEMSCNVAPVFANYVCMVIGCEMTNK